MPLNCTNWEFDYQAKIGWKLIMLKWMSKQQLIQVDENLAVFLFLFIHFLMLLPLLVAIVCVFLV